MNSERNGYSREAGDASKNAPVRRQRKRRRRISEMVPESHPGLSRDGREREQESYEDFVQRREETQEDATDYKSQYHRVRESQRDQYGEERSERAQRNGTRSSATGERRSNQSDNRQRRGSNQRNRQGGGRQGGQRNQRGNRRPQRRVNQPPVYDEIPLDPMEEIRLNKFLSNSGVCSRREADKLIEAGAVVVNGEPVTRLGTKVRAQDRVEVNGKEITPENKVYVLLNKPQNCVTTCDDPQERRTVMHLVRTACKERIYPVGRLDRNTTGVLLLTNDGELASKLVHPSYKKKKVYHVWLDKEVTPEHMQQIADGIMLEDGEIHADAISYADEEDHTQVGIELHSGRNRIVRRLFEHLGYHVKKLDRVYFAGLTKKNLGRGKWRYLTQEEVNRLRMGAYE